MPLGTYEWGNTQTPTGKTPPQKRSVERLSNTLEKQLQQYEWATDKPAKKKPNLFMGVTGRIFDTLSRPIYGVSEGLARAAEHLGDKTPESRKGKNPLTDILGGVVGGVAGKNKTYFAETLKRAAEADPDSLLSKPIRENRYNITSAAGLVGDIALDPTTYLGVGVVKSIGKEALEKTGARAAESVLAKGLAHEATKKPVREAINEAVKTKGSKLTSQEYDEVANAVKERLTAQAATKAADEAKTAARLANKGKVEFKFAGRKIGESEKLFQASQAAAKKIGGTELGQSAAKKFRTGATYVGKTNVFKRRFENEGVAVYEDIVKKMRNGEPQVVDDLGNITSPERLGFKDLTKQEKKELTHAIENGGVISGKSSKSGRDLQEYLDDAKERMQELFDLEVNMGLRSADEAMEDYVYHYYRRKGEDFKAFKDKRKGGKGKATIDEAKAANLDPVEEIDDILALRYADHYNKKSQLSFVDAVVKEYGVTAKKAIDDSVYASQGLKKATHKYVPEGTYLPPEVNDVLRNIRDMHDRPEMAGAFLRHFDKVQATWKTGATVINPGHHVRNLIGDTYMNYLDGVVNPYRYKQSLKLLTNKNNAEALNAIKIRVGKQNVSGDKVLRLYEQYGAKSGFYRTEFGEGKLGLEKLRGFSEGREDFGRMAHFIDSLMKEGKGVKGLDDLEKAADAAAQRVRKWNIDYGDLTEWERKYGKRAIPFYTWMRKNIPLQIEAMALRPGRVAAVPKAQRAMEQALGTYDPEGSSIGEIIPQYLKEMSPIRLRGEGEGKNAWYWNVPLPVLDVGRMAEGGPVGTIKEVVSSVTPIARVPIELAAGKNIFTGQRIDNLNEYFMQQLPIARQGYALQSGTQDPMSARMLNYLTGLGISSISESMQLGELRRQQDPVQQMQRELNEKLRKEYAG